MTYKILILITIPIILFSCKKGEEDPFISLHTRKARLTNTWKLIEMSYKLNESYSLYENTLNITSYYDGAKEIKTITENSSTQYDTVYYRIEYTFKKDYTYTKKRTETSPKDARLNDYMIEEGIWDFLSKSKTQNYKNKERIILTPTRYYNDNENYQLQYFSYVWDLVKLSSDELKVSVNNEYYNYVSGYTGTESADYLFKAQ
ncbi:MAG: hypothetical protein Kow0068_11070 [Marinilabiliales bacterium]